MEGLENAILLCQAEIDAHGPTAETCFRMGALLARADRFSEAFAALEQAIQIDPTHARACKELARLSLAANEMRAFANWCHEALRLDPGDPEPHLMMAEVLAERRRWEEARDELRLALSLRPLPEDHRARAASLLTSLEKK